MSAGPITPPPTPPQSGGGFLKIVLIILGVLVLGCAGVCGGCVCIAQRSAKDFGNYAELLPVMSGAVVHVQDDQRVKDKLGEPVVSPGLPGRDNSGEVNPVHESFHFDLTGPMGTAKATGHATKAGSFWKVTTIEVEFSDGEKVTITPPDSGPELNFDMPTESK